MSKVYINLIDQKEPTLDFNSNNTENSNQNISNKILYYKKVIKPSIEQLKLHSEYLKKTLKKNFFN